MRNRLGLVLALGLAGTSSLLAGELVLDDHRPAAPPPAVAAPALGALPLAPGEGVVCPPLAGQVAGDCADDTRLWLRADYLLWRVKHGPQPLPLVTFGSDADAPLQGVSGQAGTQLAYGGQALDFGAASGFRIGAAFALSEDSPLLFEAGWLALEKRSVVFTAASDDTGAPVIARPIINASNGNENSELVSSPLVGVAGRVDVASASRLQAWEANLAVAGGNESNIQFAGLLGFRMVDLTESVVIQDTFRDVSAVPGTAGLTFLGAPVLTGEPLTGIDSFRAYNKFYGPQVGARASWDDGRVSVGLGAKAAVGWSQQLVVITGASSAVVNPGEGRTAAAGSVLTAGGNIGRHFFNRFAVVPEGEVQVGLQVTDWAKVQLGYTFLYWSDVVRPGAAIDRTVNRFAVPSDQNFGLGVGPDRPRFAYKSTDFWAQGLTLGLECRY